GQGGVATYGTLVSNYVSRHQESFFLSSFQGSASIESLEPGNRIVSLKRIPPRPRVAEEGTSDTTVPAPTNPAGVVIGDPLEQRQKRKIQIRLANKSLAAMDLTQTGMVDTFGYCSGIKRDGAAPGAFVLDDCLMDASRQITIRIRGFEPVTLKSASQPNQANQPVRLDSLLRSRTYSVPYPAQWQGAASDRVEVTGGPVEEVLKRRIALRQFGLPGCEIVAAPTIADIVGETVSFPEPPCGTVDLLLPRELVGKVPPRVVQGCRPGSDVPAIAQDGRVRCAVTQAEMKAGSKTVQLSWATGFDPLDIPLPINRGRVLELTAADLGKHLRASLPRQDAGQGDTPIYRPSEVRYHAGAQSCGKSLPVGSEGAAPSVAEAACKGLPDRMEVTFDIDREK